MDLHHLNAGIPRSAGGLPDLAAGEFDRVMAVNVRGIFLGLRGAFRLLRLQGSAGNVVLTASIASLRGSADLTAYQTSKHAVLGLLHGAAVHGGPPGSGSTTAALSAHRRARRQARQARYRKGARHDYGPGRRDGGKGGRLRRLGEHGHPDDEALGGGGLPRPGLRHLRGGPARVHGNPFRLESAKRPGRSRRKRKRAGERGRGDGGCGVGERWRGGGRGHLDAA
ncbi:MAG TPA: SDR family NAD(P)-dependent oxidoreductase [Trebonia sp.]|nr:SDR family NAD(P)-dependent oxidoreductase [Trebonia sp.]